MQPSHSEAIIPADHSNSSSVVKDVSKSNGNSMYLPKSERVRQENGIQESRLHSIFLYCQNALMFALPL